MTSPRYITPRNRTVAGPKIRIGDGLYFFPEKIENRLSQRLLRKRTKGRTSFVEFVATREVEGTLELMGFYADEDLNALAVMRNNTALTNTEITFDKGQVLKGSLIVESCSIGDDRDGSKYNVSIRVRVSGTISGIAAGSGDADSGDTGASGDVEFPKSIGNLQQRVTLGYQDDRNDRIDRPFLIEGVDEGVVDLWEMVQLAVNAAGGDSHTYGPSASPIRVISGTGVFDGRGLIVGVLLYGRGPLDCTPNKPDIDVAYISTNFRAAGTIDSGDSGDACDQFGDLLPLAVNYLNMVKQVAPVQRLSYPAVYSSSPTKLFDSYVGKINDAQITWAGDTFDAYEMRLDGAQLRAISVRGTTYWFGRVIGTRRAGGWIHSKVYCAGTKQLPLEGTQTVPGYVAIASVRNLYAYQATTFPTLSTLIPDCGY